MSNESADRIPEWFGGKKQKFDVLHDRVLQEQNLYWSRFVAFSALHAGLFVAFAEQEAGTSIPAVPIAGAVLGVVWLLVQMASLHYTNRSKPEYYKLCAEVGLKPREHPVFRRILSSTRVGLVVCVAAAGFWGYVLSA